MNNIPDHKVGFGREARTIVYEDVQGKYIFTFDHDITEFKENGAPKRLFLDPGPGLKEDYTMLECHIQKDLERVVLMKDRVKNYLVSLGYEVKIL